MPYSQAGWGPPGAPVFQPIPAMEHSMNAMKISGIILIVLGLAGFFTGGFSFMQETTKAQIGPIQLNVKEKKE